MQLLRLNWRVPRLATTQQFQQKFVLTTAPREPLTIVRLSSWSATAGPWRRCNSTAAPSHAARDAPSTINMSLPIRHSRRQLPIVVTDQDRLHLWSHQILHEIPVGQWFAHEFDPNTVLNPTKSNIHKARQEAWNVADLAVQKVEAILRGHACQISGTTWQRWTTDSPSRTTTTTAAAELAAESAAESAAEAATSTITTMQALLDRIWQEGDVYMKLRQARLQELFGLPEVMPAKATSLPPSLQLKPSLRSRKDSLAPSSLDDLLGIGRSMNSELSGNNAEDQNDIQQDDRDGEAFINDFALPGPTTNMYDTILDAMACTILVKSNTQVPLKRVAADVASTLPLEAHHLLETVLRRHSLDGGHCENACDFTRPTSQSFNATIRVAAAAAAALQQPSLATEPDLQKHRDHAIHVAIESFLDLSQADGYGVVTRNSATYTHMLSMISHSFPASRMRGNMALGLWTHASEQGLIDDEVVHAMIAANTPSNSDLHDSWLQKNQLRTTAETTVSAKQLPQKWRRFARVKRCNAGESTY